jgi:hypothetical protein
VAGEYSQEQLQAFFRVINQRLDRIEEHLLLLANTVHVPYATYAQSLNIPDEVLALARDGKTARSHEALPRADWSTRQAGGGDTRHGAVGLTDTRRALSPYSAAPDSDRESRQCFTQFGRELRSSD